jgi:hypothetical protein
MLELFMAGCNYSAAGVEGFMSAVEARTVAEK